MRVFDGFPIADGVREEITLGLDAKVPEFKSIHFLEENRAWYGVHARRFVGALMTYAPGGFVDAVLGELLFQNSCVFRVPLNRETARPVCGAKAVRHNTAYVCQLEPDHVNGGNVHDDGAGTTWSDGTFEVHR